MINVGGFQAEAMTLPSGTGAIYSDPQASKGEALLLWSNTIASRAQWVKAPSNQLRVRAKGDQCDGAPRMAVRVNGIQVLSTEVTSSIWKNYYAPTNLGKGMHRVEITFDNDYRSSACDRNLRLDLVQFQMVESAPTPEPTPEPDTGNPFAGEKFYVNPHSAAGQSGIEKIAQNPTAAWFGDWNSDIQSDVNNYVSAAKNASALPVLVAYNIPIRDCGSYSSGGATSAAAYRSWIDAFAAGVNGRKSVVILEPDATALQHCLTQGQKDERNALLKYAVDTLTSKGAFVYLDAGHNRWIDVPEMVTRLKAAGVANARGFALNVSNYERTLDAVAYGDKISTGIGGKGFIVDTSRNGNGPDPNGEWCNNPNAGLGEKPTASTGQAKVDAYFWIKPPGESDGTCNGGPPAGQWWQQYAEGLAQRAAY